MGFAPYNGQELEEGRSGYALPALPAPLFVWERTMKDPLRKPLQFGNIDQIKALHKKRDEAERAEKFKKWKVKIGYEELVKYDGVETLEVHAADEHDAYERALDALYLKMGFTDEDVEIIEVEVLGKCPESSLDTKTVDMFPRNQCNTES